MMSAAGRRRQLGWLAILQIYCKCNRERQDGSQGHLQGEGRGTLLRSLFACSLTSMARTRHQLHREILSAETASRIRLAACDDRAAAAPAAKTYW